MTQPAEIALGTALAVTGLAVLAAAGLVWVIGQSFRQATRPRGPHTHIPAPRKEPRP